MKQEPFDENYLPLINPGFYQPNVKSEFGDDSFFNENIQKHICPSCGKHFNRSNDLKRHIMYVHEGVKMPRVVCDTCGKDFSNQQHLRHGFFNYLILNFHTGC